MNSENASARLAFTGASRASAPRARRLAAARARRRQRGCAQFHHRFADRHLLWHGVDAQVALELMLAWNRLRCRPPLDDAEVAGVVQSIVRLHEKETGDGVA